MTTNTAAMEANIAVRPFHVDIAEEAVVDGLDVHFIHVRSPHQEALPLIVSHGWPGSIIEQLKIIEPLTNPTANGGSTSDAFHLVVPSLPG